MLASNGRRARVDETGLSFKTPDAWRIGEAAIAAEYECMLFDRKRAGNGGLAKVFGVRHRLVDKASFGPGPPAENIAAAAVVAAAFGFPAVRSGRFVARDWGAVGRDRLVMTLFEEAAASRATAGFGARATGFVVGAGRTAAGTGTRGLGVARGAGFA